MPKPDPTKTLKGIESNVRVWELSPGPTIRLVGEVNSTEAGLNEPNTKPTSFWPLQTRRKFPTTPEQLCALSEKERLKLEESGWKSERGRRITSEGIHEIKVGLWRSNVVRLNFFTDRVPQLLIQSIWACVFLALYFSMEWSLAHYRESLHWSIRAGHLLVALCPALVLCWAKNLHEIRFWRAPRWLRQLLDVPSYEQCLVQVRIVRDRPFRKTVGIDYGVVTFTGDVLHFEGRKTSFDLPNQIVSFRSLAKKTSDLNRLEKKSGPYILRWQAGDVKGKVEFHVYKKIGRSKVDNRKKFIGEMKSLISASTHPHQTITLPPFPKD